MQARRTASNEVRKCTRKKTSELRSEQSMRPRLCGFAPSTLQQRFSVVTAEEHANSDSGMGEIHALREKVVREDITRRLRGVCSNFSDDEFEKLVRVMAARQVRCERRQSW